MLKKTILIALALAFSHTVVFAEQGQNPPKPESMADYCKKHTC
jgi:hypothetical protein